MKKLFFIAAIAGAALVSCTKNELAPSVTAQEEISFTAPVVGVQTKVYGAIGATYNTGESFDVWCVYNVDDIAAWGGTPYFSDVTASYDATVGGWTLNPKYYWPATGQLSFVALSPSMITTTAYTAAKGFEITGWSQGVNENAIVDLMYSDISFDNEKSSFVYDDNKDDDVDADSDDSTLDYIYNGANIKFNHALSYITFKVKTAANYAATTIFKLKTITLDKIYTTGNFVQIPEGTAPNWTVASDAVGKYIAYTSTGEAFGYASKDDTDQTVLSAASAEGKEIILLPQTLTDGKQNLKIDYQISTDGGTTWINQTQSIDLSKGGVAAWEMGKKYTYTLSISMTEIILDPAVTVWDEIGSGALNL